MDSPVVFRLLLRLISKNNKNNNDMEQQEKKDWVEKFSKDELIEDIKREFDSDAKNNIGCGGLVLLLIVYNIVMGLVTGDWASTRWTLPAFLLALFGFDTWWKKKMSKCEDAHRLVDMYDKYTKANKIFGYIAAFVLVLYIGYDIYSDFGKVSLATTLLFSALALIIIGFLVWSHFNKGDKKPVEKELEHLRDLLSKE